MPQAMSKFKYEGVIYDIKDAKARQDLAECVNNGYYDSNAKKIILRHDSDIIVQIDATDFIKDGMVSNVQIINGYLVITFNTDSGQEPISIPITDIFNPDNYYTKSATNELLSLKQNVIQDLATIRSGAQAGATAYQKPQGGIPLSDINSNDIDAAPTQNSNKLVRSGGVQNELALGTVYDVSAHNNSATFASLSALLSNANIDTLIPTSVRKGGMSIKFVQSSDNNYMQFRYLLQYEDTTAGNAAFVNPENWEGEELQIEESVADFSISDIEGNSIVIFSGGHVKTKKFDSAKIIRAENNETFTDFDITDENDNAIISVKDGYPETKKFDGKKIKESIEDATGRITALEEYVDSIADELYETVVVNIADYNNNLLNVYAAISPTKNKHYTILVPEGIYDVSSWFTQEYIEASQSDSTKRGVVLMDYTKLLGIGSYDKTIFQWMNDDANEKLGNISTLNTHQWNEVENITVKANNIRYAVHDDPAGNGSRYLRVKNCAFIVSGKTSRAWGGGFHSGEYNGEFVNCKFILKDWPNYHLYGQSYYIEPFVLHDYASNTVADSYLTFRNCRFVNPYMDFKWRFDSSWEQVAYDSSYAAYNSEKTDYAVDDCVNMPNDTEHSYKCLYANTQLPPYKNGRPCINVGFGASGATKTLYVTIEGCSLNSYLMTNPYLSRITGFGNKMGSSPTLNAESTDNKDIIIDII